MTMTGPVRKNADPELRRQRLEQMSKPHRRNVALAGRRPRTI
jgi:hypothetical protein